jgi:hypothetical protein
VSRYDAMVAALWGLSADAGQDGRPRPWPPRFSPAADAVLQGLERWIEPQLGADKDLSRTAGWANKLAGAAARIAGVLHVATAVGEGRSWRGEVGARTAQAAVRLARDYLLPHALAALALMGADKRAEEARRVWESIRRRCESSEDGESAPPLVSRRDLHQWNRRTFDTVEQLDPVIEVLVDRYHLRPATAGAPGRGQKSPTYEVNVGALLLYSEDAPRPHCTHSGRTWLTGEAEEVIDL